MTARPHKQAITAAHVGCAAAAGYAAVKTAWGLGSTVGVRDTAVMEDFMAQIGGPLIAVWATVLLALLASAILQSLVQPWGRRVPRRLRASLAWLGFAIMTPVGLLGLAGTVAKAVAGQPDPMLTPAIYIGVYSCFLVLGLSFAVTAWRTRHPEATPTSAPRPRRSSRPAPFLAHPQEDR
ncbi:MAG: hypothetical protein M3401_04570 [Actinomycetota bacterium]|nr:hypothetical protein [Actinomycetota bacterium]